MVTRTDGPWLTSHGLSIYISMNFKSLYTELVDLANKPDIGSIDLAKRAINRASSWCLQHHPFLLNEAETTVAYVAGTPLDVTAISMAMLDISTATGEPLDIIPYSVHKANLRRSIDLAPAGTYNLNTSYEAFCPAKSPRKLIQLGNTFELTPAPTANLTLKLHYQKAPVTLTADTDTNFLLDNLPDLILLRCLAMSTFRSRLSPEIAANFTADAFLAEWQDARDWDSRLRSTGRQML